MWSDLLRAFICGAATSFEADQRLHGEDDDVTGLPNDVDSLKSKIERNIHHETLKIK